MNIYLYFCNDNFLLLTMKKVTSYKLRVTLFLSLFFFAVFSVLLLGFTGCEKTNVDNLFGRWKLTEVYTSFNNGQNEVIDYTTNDIIYDFRKNGQLIITGAIPDILYIFDDFQEGKHYYKCIFPGDDCISCDYGKNLIIQRNLGGAKKRYGCAIGCWTPSGCDALSISGEKTIEDVRFSFVKHFIKLK